MRLCSQLPIATSYSRSVAGENKDQKGDEEMEVEDKDTGKKFVKTFPEEGECFFYFFRTLDYVGRHRA